ncbi:hypothetical protein PR048_003756 [Dryococelus australis]|uniref:Uncharacterized protein n=1 Tax=Dryococelus australis TaxID=614101 RepID=A0ABQ9INX1_9NEOP|nr:hypothetical protein PR048_003756 [Dryococelus australis]
MSAYTRQIAKSKYRNRIRLEKASQNKSSDIHETPYYQVKRCRELKKYTKASERVNAGVFTKTNGRVPNTATPHCFLSAKAVNQSRASCVTDQPSSGKTTGSGWGVQENEDHGVKSRSHNIRMSSLAVTYIHYCKNTRSLGATVAERLSRSPPTKANRVQYPARSHVGIAPVDAAGRRVFSGISRFPPHFHSGTAPCSPRFTLIGSQDLDIKADSQPPTWICGIFAILCKYSFVSCFFFGTTEHRALPSAIRGLGAYCVTETKFLESRAAVALLSHEDIEAETQQAVHQIINKRYTYRLTTVHSKQARKSEGSGIRELSSF